MTLPLGRGICETRVVRRKKCVLCKPVAQAIVLCGLRNGRRRKTIVCPTEIRYSISDALH